MSNMLQTSAKPQNLDSETTFPNAQDANDLTCAKAEETRRTAQLSPENPTLEGTQKDTPRGRANLRPGNLEALAKAQEARIRKAAERQSSTLLRDFAHDLDWRKLARVYDVKLPGYGTPMTPTAMRRYLRALGYDIKWYQEWSGWLKLQNFIAQNGAWPLRGWVGMLLLLRERDDADARKEVADAQRQAA